MTTVEEGLRSQLRNIEATYGRSIGDWIELIRASGLTRHGQIVAMLKADHGLAHGAANRVALVALDAAAPPPADPVDALYADRPAVRAIHDRVWETIRGFGDDVETAPKKGYLSLRRRTQFAMVKPAAKHLDLALVLPDAPTTERFESAATFNALFTHRVRIRSEAEVDGELTEWISRAYDRAG
jgi:uncharacterized protein DUF5655/uncharacterized protein DUF4287